tara:strand:+ start:1210 stop:1824 length:615 start_codon:yes stop_codon:yes gene_type:complete
MSEVEGVIKFNLDFKNESIVGIDVLELSAWRNLLRELGLLGKISGRYGGLSYGNISQRHEFGFLISGTQTGKLEALSPGDFAFCETWDLARNKVCAKGRVKPSSESLSHASIYDAKSCITCAFHVHSPDIWRNSAELGIATTDSSITYGTPDMAREVQDLVLNMGSYGIFSMGGHEDGVFTYGRSLPEAGQLMIGELVRARMLL